MHDNDDLFNEDGSIKLPNPFGIAPSTPNQQPSFSTGLDGFAQKSFDSFQEISRGIEMPNTITRESMKFGSSIVPPHVSLPITGDPGVLHDKPNFGLNNVASVDGITNALHPTSELLESPFFDAEEEEKKHDKEEKEKIAKQQEHMAKEIEEIKKTSSERKEVYIFDPQKLVHDHPLSESPYIRSFMNKIEQADHKLNWKCNFCGRFMKDAPRLDCYSAVERLYEQFSEGGYVTCKECRAGNFFIVTADTIIFNCIQSLTIDPVKHAVKKNDGIEKTDH